MKNALLFAAAGRYVSKALINRKKPHNESQRVSERFWRLFAGGVAATFVRLTSDLHWTRTGLADRTDSLATINCGTPTSMFEIASV